MKRFLQFIFGAGIIILIFFIYNKSIERKIAENTCVTTTNYLDLYTGADGQRMVRYSITVEGKEYKSATQLNMHKESRLNDKIQVRYECNNPKINRLIFKDTTPLSVE